jgi:hypothetical protein
MNKITYVVKGASRHQISQLLLKQEKVESNLHILESDLHSLLLFADLCSLEASSQLGSKTLICSQKDTRVLGQELIPPGRKLVTF